MQDVSPAKHAGTLAWIIWNTDFPWWEWFQMFCGLAGLDICSFPAGYMGGTLSGKVSGEKIIFGHQFENKYFAQFNHGSSEINFLKPSYSVQQPPKTSQAIVSNDLIKHMFSFRSDWLKMDLLQIKNELFLSHCRPNALKHTTGSVSGFHLITLQWLPLVVRRLWGSKAIRRIAYVWSS